MPYLKYQDREFYSRDGENVLDAMLRHGIEAPFSCRNGVCHVCVQQCTQGNIPHVAQHGLSAELREHNYFMTCKCIPLGDMEIMPPAELYKKAVVHSKEMLSPHVCKLLLDPPADFPYRPGQFVNLRNPNGVVRSYSLAGLPEDYFLELHIQRKDGGAMSNWLIDELATGTEIDIQNASGDSCYTEAAQGHPLLLVATGTGLAPVLGILREALQKKHSAPIHLYHGGRNTDRFYLHDQLHQLAQQHQNFHYHECLSSHPNPPAGIHAGRAHEVAFAQHQDLRGWHVYLAGLTAMVESGERLAAQHGAAPEAIHADAFSMQDKRSQSREEPAAPAPDGNADHGKYPPPDPELWNALREGEMLMAVLRDFYTQVFADDRLSSFFHGTTKQRSIEKQYLFTRQILTGEKIYFGDRPRNSHHWMVISDDLFDYRAEIMVSWLRKHGLSEPMIHRFRAMEEFYRRDIVKSAPYARVMGNVEIPFEGFGEIVMDVGTLCDSCEREVSAGEKVIYHVRLGKIYCSDCSSQHHHEIPATTA